MNEINLNVEDLETINLSMDVGIREVYPPLENLEVTPTKEQQVFNHENSYGYDNVTVEPIPDEYIIPDGTLDVAENGDVDVTMFKTARVGVYTPPRLQDKEVTPTKQAQNITSDEGYDGLNEVTVNAIPDNYIEPSGTLEITENGTYDVKQYASANVNVSGGSGGGDIPEAGFMVNECNVNGYASKITIYGIQSTPNYAFGKYSATGYKSGAMALDGLQEVVLDNGLKILGDNSFRYQSLLEKVTFPSTLNNIGWYAFYGCSKLVINELPDNITTIGDYAFSGCSILPLNKLPAKLTTLGQQAFRNCPLLAIKTIPDGVTKLLAHTFNGCSGLTQLSMNKVKSIHDYSTFSGCTGLKALWIGSAITNIADGIFGYSSNLQKIYIDLPRTTVETFGGYANAFSGGVLSTDIIVCNDDDGFITKEEFDATTF